jgi:hypothetical protein
MMITMMVVVGLCSDSDMRAGSLQSIHLAQCVFSIKTLVKRVEGRQVAVFCL